jgi:hypothetical protein
VAAAASQAAYRSVIDVGHAKSAMPMRPALPKLATTDPMVKSSGWP